MKKQTGIMIAVIVLVIILGVALAKERKAQEPMNDHPATAGSTTTTTGTQPDTSVAGTQNSGTTTGVEVGVDLGAQVKTFTVDGDNFKFVPNTLSVNKGDTVKIIFKNTGGMHDLRIDEFGVATKKIQGGQEDTVQFVADKAGSFQYYCSVGGHRAMGMWGTLTVK